MKLKSLLPTKSGFLLLLSLALIIGGLHAWITWVLETAPEGSQVISTPQKSVQPSVSSEPNQ